MALLSMVLAGLMSVVPAYGQTQSGASDEKAEAATADHSDSEGSKPTVMQMMAPGLVPAEPNTMMRGISSKAKMHAAQAVMSVNPLSLRDMINMMTTKIKVEEGLTLEEVVESMNLRANLLNMRLVGHNTPWKIMESISGEPMPKVEILSYCDVMTTVSYTHLTLPTILLV